MTLPNHLLELARAALAEAPGHWTWDPEFPHDLVTAGQRQVLHLGHLDKRMSPVYAYIAAASPDVIIALCERVQELEADPRRRA